MKQKSFFRSRHQKSPKIKMLPSSRASPTTFLSFSFSFFFFFAPLVGNISLNLKCEGITFVIVIARAHQIASSL